jgi:hypothetical protein
MARGLGELTRMARVHFEWFYWSKKRKNNTRVGIYREIRAPKWSRIIQSSQWERAINCNI